MSNLLGVDIGTTSLKACVFNDRGEELCSTTKSYTLITSGEFVEFPAEDYFKLFLEAFNELSSKVKIDALAVDTQGETMILLDENGLPLCNAVVWLDNRATIEAEEMQKAFTLKTIYEVTGQTEVPAGFPAPKIMWFKKNKPEIFAKTKKILLLEDYILYRLTGEYHSERSLYSSSLYLDVRTGEYYKDMLDYLGITENMLPTLHESGEKVGEYLGVIVSTGALDQIAGFVGSGSAKKGVVCETTGTCLAVCAYSDKIPPYYEGIKVPAHYVKKGVYCLLMFAPTAGMVMEWYKKTFANELSLKEIDELAKEIPFGSEGLVVAPNMRGSVMPENDGTLKGGVYGIDLKHTRAHFARAVMEAVACLLRQYLECIDVDANQIICLGGGAKSPLWMQIKADIIGKNTVALKNKETGCLGSAVFAGVGAKIYDSVDDAISKTVEIAREITPSQSRENGNLLYNKFLSYSKMLSNREEVLNDFKV